MIQESPSFIWNLLKMIGNVFKISASATAIHPTKIPAQKPYTYKSQCPTGRLISVEFRTMIQDAEKDGHARLAANDDDRILPVGKFLRATRLDELPQLINILKGEMSLVGPRPERPELAAEIEKELPEFAYRLKVKSGLTGYAQIYGKYNTTAYDKLKLDLTYIRNYSFFLDLKLMIMTPKIMLMKESSEGVIEHDASLQRQEIAAAKMDIKIDDAGIRK